MFVYLCISCSHIRVVIWLRELLSTPRSAANWSPNRTGSDRAGRSLDVPVQNISTAYITYYIIIYHILSYSNNSIFYIFNMDRIVLATHTTCWYKTFHQDLLLSSTLKTKYSVRNFWSSIWKDLFVNKQSQKHLCSWEEYELRECQILNPNVPPLSWNAPSNKGPLHYKMPNWEDKRFDARSSETSDTLTSLEFILNILGFMPRCGSECMEMRSWYERGQGAGQVPR